MAQRVRVAVLFFSLLGSMCLVPPATLAACPGDCRGDGTVTVDDLLIGVNLILEIVPLSRCPVFDVNGDAHVTIDDLIIALNAALNGCPATPTPTPTGTPTVTPTPTVTDTPTATVTPTVNHAPLVPTRSIYRAYPGYEIRFAVGAVDPENDAIVYTADNLPDGAALDASTGIFSWTPRDDQLGPFYIPVTCADQGAPPLSADALLVLKVSPADLCTMPTCDPESGCVISLPPVTEACCTDDEPTTRVAEPRTGCPDGSVLFVGRNEVGFGRLQDCDTLRVTNFAQSGAVVRFHVETRCLNADLPVIIRGRMETQTRLVFAAGFPARLQLRDDGFAENYSVVFPVGMGAPYFDLQDAEANLHVSVQDVDNVIVEQDLRVKLTFTPIPDLPESDATATGTATPTPSDL
jgi:hypothetical protein